MKGEKFGMLTIIKDTGKKIKNGGTIFLCKCDCGSQKEVSWKLLKNENKPRSCGCSRKLLGKKRFESLFEKKEGCWEWKGSVTTNGYGKFRSSAASRASYQYYIGEITRGMQVCHTCDNRKCVNPAHLFLGTISDNMKDKNSKNRQAKGSKIANSILRDDIVLEIRKKRLAGAEYQFLSDEYEISWYLVICKNRQWKHVALGDECKNYISRAGGFSKKIKIYGSDCRI